MNSTVNQRRPGKKMLLKCFLFLVLGAALSFSALAVTVTGSTFTFAVGDKNYTNFAELNSESSAPKDLVGKCSLSVNSGTVPAGYLGTKTYIDNASTGKLVTASDWFYTTSAQGSTASLVKSASTPAGTYRAQGETAVYYNGGYVTKYTYGTPNINVN